MAQDTQGFIRIPAVNAGYTGPGGAGTDWSIQGVGTRLRTEESVDALAMGGEGLGRGLAKAGAVFQEIAEEKALMDALGKANAYQDEERAALGQMEQLKSRAGVEESQKFMADWYQKSEAKLMDGARGSIQQNYLSKFFQAHRAQGLDRALSHSLSQFEVYKKETLDAAASQTLAATDADPGQMDLARGAYLAAWRRFNPHAGEEAYRATDDQMKQAQVQQGVSAFLNKNDMAGARAFLESQKTDAVLHEQLWRKIDTAEKSRAVNTKAYLDGPARDHFASIQEHGAGIPGLRDQAEMIMGAASTEFESFRRQEDFAQIIYEAFNAPAAVFLTPEEKQAEMARLLENKFAGQVGAEEEIKLRNEALRHYAQDRKAFAEAPVDYVARAADEIVKTSYGPEAKVSMGQRIEARHVLMRQNGYNEPGSMPVLTKAEAAALTSQWENATPNEKIKFWNQIQTEYGPYADQALAEMKGAGPLAGYMANMAEASDPIFAQTVIQADSMSLEDISKLLRQFKGTSADKTISELYAGVINQAQVDGNFLSVMKRAFDLRPDDPDASERYQGALDLMVKVAAQYMTREGLSEDKAVSKAVNALGREYQYITSADLGAVIVPREYDARAVEAGLRLVRSLPWVDREWDDKTSFFRNFNTPSVALSRPSGQVLEMPMAELQELGRELLAGNRMVGGGRGGDWRQSTNMMNGRDAPKALADRAFNMTREANRRSINAAAQGGPDLIRRTVDRLKAEEAASKPPGRAVPLEDLVKTSGGRRAGEDGPKFYQRIYGYSDDPGQAPDWLPRYQGFRANAAQYAGLMEAASAKYGVPKEIIASVMAVESRGQSGAVSPTGVTGLMQMTDKTYRDLGFSGDRADPENSVMAGGKLLSELYRRYRNWPEALADYNGGPDGVKFLRGQMTAAQLLARHPKWGPGKPSEIMKYAPRVFQALQSTGFRG